MPEYKFKENIIVNDVMDYINKTYDCTACTGTSFCGCGVCHNYEAAE